MASTTLAVLPLVDLSAFLAGDAADPAVQDACRAVAECLRDTGALIVRDPRVNAQDNSRFLDMMEAYFSQPHEAKLEDVHSELCYQARAVRLRVTSRQMQPCARCPRGGRQTQSRRFQVGVTPELVETPRCTVRAGCGLAHARRLCGRSAAAANACCLSRQMDPECVRVVQEQPEEHRATMPRGPDPKWRFFWRVGPRPAAGSTRYAELNAAPVIPKVRSMCTGGCVCCAAHAPAALCDCRRFRSGPRSWTCGAST